MNVFDLIKERLRAKKDNVAHNLQLFREHGNERQVSFCETKLDTYVDALSIVYEVEAEYGNRWIPVEKELPPAPEENPEFEGHFVELYLVSMKNEKYPFRAMWNGKMFTDGYMEVHPEAWMPLPESWKGEADAKEK